MPTSNEEAFQRLDNVSDVAEEPIREHDSVAHDHHPSNGEGKLWNPEKCTRRGAFIGERYGQGDLELHLHFWDGNDGICETLSRLLDRSDPVIAGRSLTLKQQGVNRGGIESAVLVAIVELSEKRKRMVLRIVSCVTERLHSLDSCDSVWNDSAHFIEPTVRTFPIRIPLIGTGADREARSSSETLQFLLGEIRGIVGREFGDCVVEGGAEVVNEIAEYEAKVRRSREQLDGLPPLILALLPDRVWVFTDELFTGGIELGEVLFRPVDLRNRQGFSHGA